MKYLIKYSCLFVAFICLFQNCEFKVSTATILNARVCDKPVEGQFLCSNDTPSFTQKSPKLYASCELKYAPEDTEVTFSWYGYPKGEKVLIDAVTLRAGDHGNGSSYQLRSFLNSPSNGWPKGAYEVVISLDTNNSEPVIKKFMI